MRDEDAEIDDLTCWNSTGDKKYVDSDEIDNCVCDIKNPLRIHVEKGNIFSEVYLCNLFPR
jgi:hypothetical protein